MEYTLEGRLNLLKKINKISIRGKPIYTLFIYQEYSAWSFFQHLIWDDIQKFSANPDFFRAKEKFDLKGFFLKAFALSISLLSLIYFSIRKPRILIYSVDVVVNPIRADIRIGKIYDYLRREKVPYGEFIHTIFNKKFFLNFFKRKRPVFYLETIDFIFSFLKPFIKSGFSKINSEDIDLFNFSDKEKDFVKWIIYKYSTRAELAIFKVSFLKKIIKIIKPSYLFAIDDSRYYYELLLAFNLAGIKTFSFQHGRFNRYMVGYINYEIPPRLCIVPDKTLVWNEYWKNKLLNLSPIFRFYKGRILVGGKPHFRTQIAGFIETIKDDLITILIPYEPLAYKEEITEYVKNFLNCPDVKVIFKLRKDIPESAQVKNFDLDTFINNQRFEVKTDLSNQELEKIDIVAGTYSTLLYEMLEMGKSVLVLKTTTTQAGDLVDDGLANWLDLNSKDFCSKVKQSADTDKEVLENRAEVLKVQADISDTLNTLF